MTMKEKIVSLQQLNFDIFWCMWAAKEYQFISVYISLGSLGVFWIFWIFFFLIFYFILGSTLWKTVEKELQPDTWTNFWFSDMKL